MFRIDRRNLFLVGLFVALGMFLLIIPLRVPLVYLSPDETAVAVAAREFGTRASFRLEYQALEAAPWLHPRSWVTHQGAVVPVGFLGLPILAGLVWKIFGELGMLVLTPLLVLAAIFPLWRFLRGLGWYAQVSGVVAWLTFPTVILYANRGLFPNLALVCLMLWSAYLVWDKPGRWSWLASGFLFGLAGAIRPTEILWMAIWIAAAFWAGKAAGDKTLPYRGIALFFFGAAFLPLAAAFMAWRTYGTPFAIGYWLRDPIVDAASGQAVSRSAGSAPGWPFGFHPRNVWFNLKGYLFGMLAPWALVSLGAAAIWFRQKRSRLPVFAGAATLVLLSLVYGQAIYQDHVGYNIVSLGNSFLRYLLPVVPFIAASVAVLVGFAAKHLTPLRAKIFALLLAGGLGIFGVWAAVDHDDEGLRQNVEELDRYELVRQSAYAKYGRRAIVVSDRSDKIFFPVMWAVSPMPDDAKLKDLVDNYPEPVLMFDSIFDMDQLGAWYDRGFLLKPVIETKNQRLYEVIPLSKAPYRVEDIWQEPPESPNQ